MGERLRLVLAEDNLLVRAGLVALLDDLADFTVSAVCSSLDELLTAVRDEPPDVVITDIRMPPTFSDEGLRVAAELRRSHPEVGVVVLSQYLDPGYALALVEDGSQRRGYLLKERVAEPEHLHRAISAVAEGGSYIDPAVVDALVAARAKPAESPLHRLTQREVTVLEEIAAGRSNAAIGRRLFISERAVEKHINSIFAKLDLSGSSDVHRRVAAVLMFLSRGR